MSWLSKQFKSAGKLVKDPKKWAENAGRTVGGVAKTIAPVLPLGFRELAAVGGSIAAGDNMKSHLKSLAMAEIGAALGGSKVGSALGKIPGVSKVGSMVGKIPGVSQAGNAIGKIPGIPGGGAAAAKSGASGLTLPTGAKMGADGMLTAAKTMNVPMLGNGATSAGKSGLLGMLSKAGTLAKQNPLVVGQIASGAMGARAQSQANALERKRFEEEERRRRQLSELFAPLVTSTLGNGGFITPYTPHNPTFGR